MKLTRRTLLKLFSKSTLISAVPAILIGCSGGGGGGRKKKQTTPSPAVQNTEDGTWIRFVDS